jgi:hypothetical protein
MLTRKSSIAIRSIAPLAQIASFSLLSCRASTRLDSEHALPTLPTPSCRSAGNTALHCAATKSSHAAVAALLELGGDRAAVNLNGETPFGVAHRPPRAPASEPAAFVNPCDCQALEAEKQRAAQETTVTRARVERERSAYDTILALIPPGQPRLTDGCMTPRMLARLRCVSRIAHRTNSTRIEQLDFQPRKPRDVTLLDKCLVWFADLPNGIFDRYGGEVFKSFVMGWAAIVMAVASLLDPEHALREQRERRVQFEEERNRALGAMGISQSLVSDLQTAVWGPRRRRAPPASSAGQPSELEPRVAKLPTVQRVMEDIICPTGGAWSSS